MAVGRCKEKAGGPPANRTEKKRGRKRDGPPVLKSCMFRFRENQAMASKTSTPGEGKNMEK